MNAAGRGADSNTSATTGHSLPHGDSQLIQREVSVKDNSVGPSTGNAEPGAAQQGMPPTDEPKRLRIADAWYDSQGQPLPINLSAAGKQRLDIMLAKLQKDDPKFYAEIEKEDLVVTLGTLAPGNVGRHVLSVQQKSLPYSEMRAFLFEHSGADPSQGPPNPPTEPWLKAVDEFRNTYSEAEQLKMSTTKAFRVSFSSVLILDLDQIDKQQKVYEKEYQEYKNRSFSSPGVKPELPQSAMGTLRHEAGHLVFERAIFYDKFGNPLPSKTLPESLRSEVEKGSHSENIRTDMELLSEYAAEGLDDPIAGKPGDPEEFEPFDIDKFREENDPKFGVGGYHDIDGGEQTPSGFGVLVAQEQRLIIAKQTARALKAVADEPMFLLTVLKPKTEQRLFNVLILEGADRESVRDKFDQLKKIPALANYKESTIVAY